MTHPIPGADSERGTREYRIYLHGDHVGFAKAETKGEAVTQFANINRNQNENGLMALAE